jgi:hypothetical protein
MRFDTKIAIAVRDDLAQWQRLNVTAFLASGIAAGASEIIGKPYEDRDGNLYLGLFRQPVLIYAGSPGELVAAHRRALARDLAMAIYTMDMFGTGHDDDNRAVVRGAAALELAGLAVYGARNAVDKVTKGFALHP